MDLVKRLGRMDLLIRGVTSMARNTARAIMFGRMEVFTREAGIITKYMGRVLTNGQTAEFT